MEWAPGTGSKQEIYGDWGKGKKETEMQPSDWTGTDGRESQVDKGKNKIQGVNYYLIFIFYFYYYHYY